eukprot:750625-Hanusia_phi.AAC.1
MSNVGSARLEFAIARGGGTSEDRIRSKRYLAGGSCRFMFQSTGPQLTEELARSLSNAADLELILQGNNLKFCSLSANRLMARYSTEHPLGCLPLQVADTLSYEAGGVHRSPCVDSVDAEVQPLFQSASVRLLLVRDVVFPEFRKGLEVVAMS